MTTLQQVFDVWAFVKSGMSGDQTASFVKGFRKRFEELCGSIGIPAPASYQDWYRLDTAAMLSDEAERKFRELRNWLKKQSQEFTIRFQL